MGVRRYLDSDREVSMQILNISLAGRQAVEVARRSQFDGPITRCRAGPDHRIRAREADVFPLSLESGRGFGSVFHHQYPKSQPLSGWDFFCLYPMSVRLQVMD